MVTMGNAAACQACGSDKALSTTGSDSDLNQHADYYGAAEPGPEVDDSLVRGGETWLCSCKNFCFLLPVLSS